jgi:hypothetical protein
MADTVTICSPVALGPADAEPLAPRLSTLRGRRLGIHVDPAWRSWRVAADELATLARAGLGVADVALLDLGARLGRPEEESDRMAAFARTVDAAVVGLGT